MSYPVRVIGFILVAIFGMMSISFIQTKYDKADIQKAVKAIEYKFPEAKECHGSVLSRLRGTVMVQCFIQSQEQHWTVDVTRGIIL